MYITNNYQCALRLTVNHYDPVAPHSMWRIFLKGQCVLVRVEIIHKSKFLPGTVEKNSSTIRSCRGGPSDTIFLK